jgi:hypothetical protein
MTGAMFVGLVFGNRFRRASQSRADWPAPRSNRPSFRIGAMIHEFAKSTDFPAVPTSTSDVPDETGPHCERPMPISDGPAFNITPRLGVNQARYGMLRREVRQVLGQATSSIRRKAPGPADDVYGDRQVFIRYDASDRLHSIEFASTADVSISHYRVGGLPYALLQEQLLEWDASAAVLDSEIRSTTLGLVARADSGAIGAWTMVVYPDRQL